MSKSFKQVFRKIDEYERKYGILSHLETLIAGIGIGLILAYQFRPFPVTENVRPEIEYPYEPRDNFFENVFGGGDYRWRNSSLGTVRIRSSSFEIITERILRERFLQSFRGCGR